MPDAKACFLSEERGSVKESKSLHAKLREYKASPLAREGDSETSDENGPLPVPKSERVVSGRQHHRLRMLVDHMMCRDGRVTLLERRAARTLAARRNYRTALGPFHKCVKERVLPLVEDVETDGSLVAYSNDCFDKGVQHHHGSLLLAAVMDRWRLFSRFGPRKLPRFHTCSKGWRQLTPERTRRAMPAPVWDSIVAQLTLLHQSHMAAFILILLVTYMHPLELSDI